MIQYATVAYVTWQKERIDAIINFLEHQFFGMLRHRIEQFAERHDGGFTERNLFEIAFRMDHGKINYTDYTMLYNTFQFMRRNGDLEEEHRGRGKPIIYRLKEAKP